MNALAQLLLPEEREAARPPEEISVSEWADRYRVLPPTSPRPGPWSTDVNPPCREIMDALRADVESIAIMGNAQWGKTETMLNQLLYTVDEDPVPMMLVLPTEEDLRSYMATRVKPNVLACPRVMRHATGVRADFSDTDIAFTSCTLLGAWSTSPSRLAERSCAIVWLDEVDKYPRFSGRESSPVALAKERTRWWPRRKVVLSCTPTTEGNYIAVAFAASDQRRYHVPCLACGAWQVLAFGPTTLLWPEGKTAAEIVSQRLAFYRCVRCGHDHADTDENRRAMIARGRWVAKEGTISADGVVTNPPHKARGYALNALYSPVLTWSEVAAEFLASKDDPASFQNFVNSWLGEPWIEKVTTTTSAQLEAHATTTPIGIVPAGTIVLVAAADLGGHDVHYVVRACGPGGRWHTVENGKLEDLEQLVPAVLNRTFEDADPTSQPWQVRLLVIDSGFHTDDVYQFCQAFEPRARPVKGWDHRATPITSSPIERDFEGKSGGLRLWNIDTTYYKDRVMSGFAAQHGTPNSWSVYAQPAAEFLRHLTAEEKVMKRNKVTGQTRAEWQKRPGGGPNHWLDAEVYASAASDMLGVYRIREKETAENVEAFRSDVGMRGRDQRRNDDRTERWIRAPQDRGRRGSWIRRRGD